MKGHDNRVPYAPESEHSLALAFIDPANSEFLALARSLVDPRDFHDRAYGEIFGSACRIADSNQAPDKVLIAIDLRSRGKLESIGGPEVLRIDRDFIVDEARVRALCATVRDSAASREIIRLSRQAAIRAQNDESPSDVMNAMRSGLDKLDHRASQATGANHLSNLRNTRTTQSLTSIADLLDEPDESVSWLVDGLLPTSGTSMLVSKPKVGKSITVQNLALCISRAEPFLGLKTTQGRVLYLALEEKRSEVRRHFKLMGADRTDDLFFHIAASPSDAMQWLVRQVAECKPALIIVDTFQRLARVNDLNDYAQVNAAMEPIGVLARESGAHLLLTHHGKKSGGSDGDAVLGSTALFASVDTLLEMRRTEGGRTIRSFQRYGANLDEMVLTMDPETYRISLSGSRLEFDEQRVEQSILAYLQGHGEILDRASIVGSVEGRAQTKHAAFRRLVEGGKLDRTGSGKKGDPFLYSISNSVVPNIYRELPERNSESADTAPKTGVYSGSQEIDASDEQGTCVATPGNHNFKPANGALDIVDDFTGVLRWSAHTGSERRSGEAL